MRRWIILCLLLALPGCLAWPQPTHALVNEVAAANRYTANGSTTAFAYTFKVYLNTDLEVLVGTTVKTLGTHYTVDGLGVSGGGNVTFLTAPLADEIVTILRKQPAAQASDYVPNEAFPSARIEKDLDKLVMQVQQLKEQWNRALTLAKSSSSTGPVVDAPTEGYFARGKVGGGIDWATVVSAGEISLPLVVASGGTGASSAASALTNLGALPTAGGTMTGNLLISTSSSPELRLNTSSGSNERVALRVYKSDVLQWIIGTDYGLANDHDFFIYDSVGLAKRIGIDSNGVIEIVNGQLKFPATQVPSADANTLDDYQEFDWTPSVGGTATYTSREGKGVKIGKKVYLHCEMVINAIGSGSTSVISGIPADYTHATTVPTYGSVGSVYFQTLSQNVVDLKPRIASGGTTIIMEALTAAGTSHSATAVIGNGTALVIDITYFAAN